jgi:hypothetical protein
MSRRSDDADLTHWCRRSAYLDQVRSLRTIEAAAGLSDLGEETGWHRNSGQARQSLKDISFQSASDSLPRGSLFI